MRRMLWAALLAVPFCLASAGSARAQCYGGGCGGGGLFSGFNIVKPGLSVPPFGPLYGLALRMYPGIHQHGPLVNYGPYEGYYPFEPYGPWTSDLRYTGPIGPQEYEAGRGGLRSHPWFSRFGGGYFRGAAGGCGSSGCGSPGLGQYALSTYQNVVARLNPFHRLGCTTCK